MFAIYFKSTFSLMLKVLIAVVTFALFISFNERIVVVADDGSAEAIGRCPKWMSEKFPMIPEREKQIYQDILKMSKKDQIVKNLMIKAGRLQGPIRTMKYTPINIQIIYHMLTKIKNGVEVGIVPITAFNKQTDVMNAAFADTGVTFSIKEIKTYSNSPYFSTCDDQEAQMKADIHISPEKYMNVWVCDSQYLGYTYMPFDYAETSYMHGIVLDYLALPEVDGYKPSAQYNEGDTLIHETGHFLGLYHTFEGGCNGAGDEVSDTAAEASEAFGMACQSNPPRDTCPDKSGVDPVTNFMDYSDDACLDHFTPLQHARMRTLFIQYKPSMSTMPPTKAPTSAPKTTSTKVPTKTPIRVPTNLPTNKPISSPSCDSLSKKECKKNATCKWKRNKCKSIIR